LAERLKLCKAYVDDMKSAIRTRENKKKKNMEKLELQRAFRVEQMRQIP